MLLLLSLISGFIIHSYVTAIELKFDPPAIKSPYFAENGIVAGSATNVTVNIDWEESSLAGYDGMLLRLSAEVIFLWFWSQHAYIRIYAYDRTRAFVHSYVR